MTISQAVHHTTRSLSQVATENPQQEARWMIEAMVGKHGRHPSRGASLRLTDDAIHHLQSCIERRNSGEPLQYILGTTEFGCITLKADRRALIPRPETEGLVELALEKIESLEKPRILDIGTGCGAIALSLLSEHAGASAVGCDISGEALELAHENGQSLGLNQAVKWILADLYSPGFRTVIQEPFDLIVCNPPYVSEAEYDDLPPTVRDWEPKIALVGGEDGLQAIRRLAQVGKDLLKKDGRLICEIGETQGEAAKTIFERFAWDAIVKKDLSGKPRYLAAKAA